MTQPWLTTAENTFLGAQRTTVNDVRSGQVVIAGAPHDSTHNTRFGARFAPRGIRGASLALKPELDAPSGFVDFLTGQTQSFAGMDSIIDVGDLNVFPTDVAATTQGIRLGVRELVSRGAFPVVLGGDHYVSYPSFLGFADAVGLSGKSKIGYVHIDGHFDFTDSNPVWGRYYHGSNARRISEHEMVSGRNMVWIGTHGYVYTSVVDAIRKIGGTIFSHEDVRRQGMVDIARRAADIASKNVDFVYITVDIDVVDAGYSPGTGGVVINGITPRELLQCVNEIVSRVPLGAADVMEVAPNLDATGRSVHLAAETVIRLAGRRLLRPM